MKKLIRASLWLALAIVLGIAPGAFAQVNLYLADAGNNNVMDNIYVGAYDGSVNGGANQQIVCDDFADESYVGHNWSANVMSVGDLNASNLGNTVWGAYYLAHGQMASTIISWYQEAAYLTVQLLTGNNSQTMQGYLSYAIWAVMDPGEVKAWLTSHGDTNAYNAVFGTNGLLANAALKYGSMSYANILIYSPGSFVNGQWQVCSPNVGGAGGNCAGQEFFGMMQVPEGGSALMYLLLGGVSCFGAMFFRQRQQVSC